MERLGTYKAPHTRGSALTCISVNLKPWSRHHFGRLCWLSCLKQLLLLHVPLLLQPLRHWLGSQRRWQKDPNPSNPQSPGGLIMRAVTVSKKHGRTFSHHLERELKSTQYGRTTAAPGWLSGSLDKGSTRRLGTSGSFKLNNKPRGRCQEGSKGQEPPDP